MVGWCSMGTFNNPCSRIYVWHLWLHCLGHCHNCVSTLHEAFWGLPISDHLSNLSIECSPPENHGETQERHAGRTRSEDKALHKAQRAAGRALESGNSWLWARTLWELYHVISCISMLFKGCRPCRRPRKKWQGSKAGSSTFLLCTSLWNIFDRYLIGLNFHV